MTDIEYLSVVLPALLAIFASFVVSSSAGLGGSLFLVPSLALLIGGKEGIALAALLLAGNNVAKVLAYRQTLPFRKAAMVVVAVTIGAALGASVLVAAPSSVVGVSIIVSIGASFLVERREVAVMARVFSPVLAFAAGATSGFSGSSGPLKGIAIRNLRLDRRHFVGAASLASLSGDAAKSLVFARESLLTQQSLVIFVAAVPIMAAGTLTGRRLNSRTGEVRFAALFWLVMSGYCVRLGLGAF